MRPPRLLLVLAAAAGVSACLDDAPLAPHSGAPARLQLAASVSAGGAALAGLVMDVRVSYRGNPQTESSPVLLDARIPIVTASPYSVELAVNIAPCLRDTLRAALGPGCEVWIDYRLASDTGTVDQQYMGPYLLTPGRRTTPDPVTLTVGSNAPAIDSLRAVLVDPLLVRYVPSATDKDQNLSGFWATYTDTLVYDFSEHLLPIFMASFRGPVYSFLSAPAQGASTALLSVQAIDSKYAASAAATARPLVPDSTTPRVDVTGGLIIDDRQARVDFYVSDPDGDAEAVEVLFRDPALATTDPGSDALLAQCVRPLGIAVGATPVFTSVQCAVTLPAGPVDVIVIPIQKNLDVGPAGRTVISVATPPAAQRTP